MFAVEACAAARHLARETGVLICITVSDLWCDMIQNCLVMDVTGGGGGACDPGAQAVDHPQPGEEAGGVRAGAQPTQVLAFLLVSTATALHTHTTCMSCARTAFSSNPPAMCPSSRIGSFRVFQLACAVQR